MIRLLGVAVVAILVASGCDSADVSRAVGARCDVKAECDERCQPPSPTFPAGFCTLSCLRPQDCPAGTRCVDIDGGICVFPCEADEECAFMGDRWGCVEQDAIPPQEGEVFVCLGSEES